MKNHKLLFQVLVLCQTWYIGAGGQDNNIEQKLKNDTSLLFSRCTVAPNICPNKNITFHLYTRSTQNKPHVLDVSRKETIRKANFIKHAEIKFLIHRFSGNKDFSPNPELRRAYFKRKNINIISVDYGAVAGYPCYIEGVQNVGVVANCSAQIVEKIIAIRKDIKLKQFHVIGFSLGGEVAGKMGDYLTIGKFERITGLDPALPLFYLGIAVHALNKDDAKFVDVIHTDIGISGRVVAAGHVDFYANNGVLQPGCNADPICSHYRSVDYYAESINSNIGFWANQCSDISLNCTKPESPYVLVGEYVNKSDRGIYYFKTKSASPYALGKPKSGRKTSKEKSQRNRKSR